MFDGPIRLASRASPLALAQTYEVRDRLLAAHPALTKEQFEVLAITTTGDKIQDRTLQAAGGKGLFTKEVEEAMLSGEADLAVHSMKDMPDQMPDGLIIDCLLPRADARDALISLNHKSIADLPPGTVVGTASVRRQALLLRQRPDLKTVPIRGNINTRLKKLAAGEVAATFLAIAGLERIDQDMSIATPLEPEEMLPAVGQGAIGVQQRIGDDRTTQLLAGINCAATTTQVTAERAMLGVLDGSCRTPIAGYARLSDKNGRIWLRGSVTHPTGGMHTADEIEGDSGDAFELGHTLGEKLRPHFDRILNSD
ncbi:MAG: hydroxymethylbilane synthase [Alphaproteobacteria bacterium]|nr:hydroxymethylbilane synthase [Alphaproteobacteria bacterium SS10]